MRASVGVPRQVDLPDPAGRKVHQILERIEPMIAGTHVDVVHIEEDSAVGPLGDCCEEFPLGDRGMLEREVARNVLHQNPSSETLLPVLDPTDDEIDRLLGVRQRKEIVGLVPTDAPPAEMIRDDRRLEPIGEQAELGEVVLTNRIRRPDRKRHALQSCRRHRSCLLQNRQGSTAAQHEVLRDDLEPIDRETTIEDERVVRGAKTDTLSE